MVRFHSCCHGSRRKKDTGWLSTPGVFADLNAVCQGGHDHDPWGVTYQMGQWKFDAASEAAYPAFVVTESGYMFGGACEIKRMVSCSETKTA